MDTSALSSYWNTAREVTGSRDIRRPIPRDQTHVVYTERWQQAESAYSVTPLGTEHSAKPDYFLVDEQILERMEDLLTFERVWATIPATRSEPITVSYTFPGYFEERDPFTLGVAGRVIYEYFLTLTPDTITLVPAQRYTNTYGDVQMLNNGGGTLFITSPTLTEYKALVAGEDEINATDSDCEPYMGPIWCRKTIKIVAR
jgi:hypothetical protein